MARAALAVLMLVVSVVAGFITGLFTLMALLGGPAAGLLAITLLFFLTMAGALLARRERCSWLAIGLFVAVTWVSATGALLFGAAGYSS